MTDAEHYQQRKDDPDEWGEPEREPTGWRCEHFTLTGRRLSDVTCPAGCDMQPIYPIRIA